MTSTQKIIKYTALAFAIALILTIVNALISAIFGLTFFFNDNDSVSQNMQETSINGSINKIEVNLKTTTLEIKEGEKFLVSTNNKKVKITEENNNLYIKEINKNFAKTSKLILYLPSKYTLKKLDIVGGAGQISLNDITTEKLKLELGAGNTKITNLDVKSNSSIEGGAGNLNIKNSTLNNLDLDIGVGNVTLEAKILGKNKIEAGIGNLNIKLLAKKQDYQIKASKGIGKITIADSSIKDDESIGKGQNYLELEGGIGNITVPFK